MYEIWLVMNIVWELALDNAVPVVFAAIVLVALTLNALRKPAAAWRRGLLPAVVVGVVAALLVGLSVPSLTRAALSDLAYWVDWLNLLAIAAGAGIVAAAFAWPVATMIRGARR